MNQKSIKPWKKLKEKIVFEKFGRKIVEATFNLPDGRTEEFYLKREKNACCVLALTKENNVVLTKQYRPGPDKVLAEMPGGYIDETDPSAMLAVTRELIEETGYEGNVQFVTKCYDDAYSTVVRHCFVATECKISSNKLRGDKSEFIQVQEIPLREFREQLKSGQLTDVEVGYLCLDHLNLL